MVTRRGLLQAAALTLAGCTTARAPEPTAAALPTATLQPTAPPTTAPTPTPLPHPPFAAATAAKLPRWKGVALFEKGNSYNPGTNKAYLESDFDSLWEWGFNFVRLPFDYRGVVPTPGTVEETRLKELDQAITWGHDRGIHVFITMQRAPGYNIDALAGPRETLNLWSDASDGVEARRQFADVWKMLATRYRGVPSAELSFNLVNEPSVLVTASQYKRALSAAVTAIRGADPLRLISADGLRFAAAAVPELVDLGIAQVTHVYDPFRLTHYQQTLVGGAASLTWPVPDWPLTTDVRLWNRDRLRLERIVPWQAVERQGVGMMISEFGCWSKTPHDVALAWMRNLLGLARDAGWGYCLWIMRSEFGIIDSGRSDVTYETYKGRKLDRKMLEILREG